VHETGYLANGQLTEPSIGKRWIMGRWGRCKHRPSFEASDTMIHLSVDNGDRNRLDGDIHFSIDSW